MVHWALRILTAFRSRTKDERWIWRRLTQRKHDLKVLRANDNSWHFYRRWKSLLSWNAFFSDFTMSLLVLFFFYVFRFLFIRSRKTPDLLRRANVKFRAMFPWPYKSRFLQRNKCRNATWHWKPIESAKSNKKWVRMIAGYFHGEYMHEDMQTSDAAPIYGLCIDKMNTRKSRSRKWKWSHNAIVKLPRTPLRRVENAAGSLLHNEKPRRRTRKV